MTEDKQTQDSKPLTLVEEAKAIRDEIVKAKEELKVENDRKDKRQAEEMLGSSAGGHIEAPKKSEAEIKKEGAKDFFKGTALEGAIDKL